MRPPEDCESSHLGDGRCKERETQQTERIRAESRTMWDFKGKRVSHNHRRIHDYACA